MLTSAGPHPSCCTRADKAVPLFLWCPQEAIESGAEKLSVALISADGGSDLCISRVSPLSTIAELHVRHFQVRWMRPQTCYLPHTSKPEHADRVQQGPIKLR